MRATFAQTDGSRSIDKFIQDAADAIARYVEQRFIL